MSRAPQCWKLEHIERGGHVHVRVRVGPSPYSRALSGGLIMESHEWDAFRSALTSGMRVLGYSLDVTELEDDHR